MVDDEDEGDGLWYEVARDITSPQSADSRDRIMIHCDKHANYGIGFRTEVVGKTTKTDDELVAFIKQWLENTYITY